MLESATSAPIATEELAQQLTSRLAASPLFGRVVLEEHDEALVLELLAASPAEVLPLLAGCDPPLNLCGEAELLAALAPLCSLEQTLPTEALRSGRAALLGLGALWHSDLGLLDLLHKLGEHPSSEVRAGVVTVASRVGYRLFLLELLAGEEDPVLRRILRSVTAFAEEPGAGP